MQWPYLPTTAVGISGSGWVDTGYRRYHAEESSTPSAMETRATQFVQQSRFTLRVTPTWTIEDKYFVQMQAELVAAQINTSQNPLVWAADDAWIRFGMWKKFDVLLGRFQAWEVYHYGMGLDLFTLERNGANDITAGQVAFPNIYGVTYMYTRQDVLGQGAVHFYPTDWLRFEVGFQYGSLLNPPANTEGVRPVAVADVPLWRRAVLRVKAGAEFIDSVGQTDRSKIETRSQGGGAALQLVFDPYVEGGANFAYAKNDSRDSSGQISGTGKNHTYSVGGFANIRILSVLLGEKLAHRGGVDDLLVGGGINYTQLIDNFFDPKLNRDDNVDQWQPYGAVQYALWNRLFIKGVFAYALANLNTVSRVGDPFKNEMWSFRLRALALF
jgi:hypothetical protein